MHGLWLAETEGAKFWLSVLAELKNGGAQDIYIARMDGLKWLPEAVNSVSPKTLTQLCIAHLVRAGLRYVTANDSKAMVAELKRIYQSASADEAAHESLNMCLRKLTRNRSIFPNDEAAVKALYRAITQASRNWKQIHH